jgi:hypothetical protein
MTETSANRVHTTGTLVGVSIAAINAPASGLDVPSRDRGFVLD